MKLSVGRHVKTGRWVAVHPAPQVGMRFGRLTIIEAARKIGNHYRCLCRCDCGNTKLVKRDNLRIGCSKSCGCLGRENLKAIGEAHAIHGECRRHGGKTAEFKVWVGIKQRCLDPNSKIYFRYGGRGITICQRWLDSYENFISDMGRRPTALHTIERKDNDGPYDPSNCRWATRTEQANNRRTNHRLTYNGETLSIAEWSRKVGIAQMTLCARIKYGWSTEKALTQPLRTWPTTSKSQKQLASA